MPSLNLVTARGPRAAAGRYYPCFLSITRRAPRRSLLFLLARISGADAAAGDYRFELAGNPEAAGGKSIVAVRLTHTPDGKPVPGAIIIQTRADMGRTA